MSVLPDAVHRIDVRRCASAPRPSLASRLPRWAGLAVFVVALINVASALTPDLPGRARTLLSLAPVQEVTLAHVAALPVGLALMVTAWWLARGSLLAARVATALLLAAGALNLLKGLDVEEATLSFGGALILWRTRATFGAASEPAAVRRALGRAVVLAVVAIAVAGLAVVGGHAATGGWLGTLRPTVALLAGTGPALLLPGWLGWLPDGVWALGLGVALLATATVLAPRRPVIDGDTDRPAAAALMRRHGSGTLGAFSLRGDLARAWAPDGDAYVAYRVEAGTLLIAGDPIGDPAAHGAALDAALATARRHGLAVGAVAAGAEFGRLARSRGLHRLYIGDEAMLATGEMDLSGGARKSLRKAVNRIDRSGYTAALHRVGDLDAPTKVALERVSAIWRDGAPERGFSMGHDQLCDRLLPDAMVVIATDADGEIRGFLHFAPVAGRPQASLAFMRRDRETPNGLMDFLVVRAAALLAHEGIEEVSLNFAPFGSLRREPAHRGERLIVRFLLLLDRFFRLGGLEHFNAKFTPRWQVRYLLFSRPVGLPRVLLAAMWAEGILPKPERPRLRSAARGPEPVA